MSCSIASSLCFASLLLLFTDLAEAATCGGGSVGDGVCPDPNLCCSQWGWCGTGPDYCTTNYCGGGSVGNGECADSTLCCSQWGYCGTGVDYCGTTPTLPPTPYPTLPPVPTVSPAPTPARGNGSSSRMVAYLGNWQTCPSEAQLASYTHIVIAFAVSYVYNPSKNICSPTCEIYAPPICENQPQPAKVASWRAAGIKVLLSFGGAGMGGSWASDNNDCWEYCYGKETYVVDQLVNYVNTMGFDGVDLDFEYHMTPQATAFLNDVTLGLRNNLPAGSELTHAPMDSDAVPGNPYYDSVLQTVGDQLDYLMPQYYNGVTRPVIDTLSGSGAGAMSALSHYNTLLNNIYSGDQSRMVFGFCISDCGGTGSNANAQEASVVMQDLAAVHPCHGGAFFWVAEHDIGGGWSSTVSNTMNSLCTTTSPTPAPIPLTPAPTVSPTSSPTSAPVSPTAAPTLAPTVSPTSSPTSAPVSPTASPTSAPSIATEAPTGTPTTDGICSGNGETCINSADCIGGTYGNSVCGNGVCETANGEDCITCAQDCVGEQGGRKNTRFCCGNGGDGAVGCDDSRCTSVFIQCTTEPVQGGTYCCGDGTCEGPEDSSNCLTDCPVTSAPVAAPTPAPIEVPTLAPIVPPTPAPTDSCLGRNAGCSAPSQCCSNNCRGNGKCG